MAKTIPIKKSGVDTDNGVLAIGTTQINITPLPTETSGYMVLDYNSASLAEEVSFSHLGSNPVTISATTKQHTGGFSWCIDNTNGYYQELGRIATNDGWINPNEAWTYASATQITVPAGAASRYSVGDKIKLTQTTVKYFYIVGVADTVLTITGGTDYTLANAAISNNYYSKSSAPVGFPDWFSYTPTLSVTAGGTAPTYTTNFVNRFKISGKELRGEFVWYNASGGVPGEGAGTLNFTLPVAIGTAYSNTNANPVLGTAKSYENGGTDNNVNIQQYTSTTLAYLVINATVITGADQSSAARSITGRYSYSI